MTDAPPTQNLVQRLGPASAVALFFAVMPMIGIGVLAVNIKPVAEFLREDWWRGIAVYTGAFAALSGLALAPTWPQSLVGGWAFGLVWGAPAAIIAAVLGSVIGTEVARGASGDRVERIIAENPRWRAVRDALVGGSLCKTVGMVVLVRLPPNSPFAITNLVLGATRVGRLANVLGTLIGIAPRTTATVYIGTTIQMLTGETLKEGPPKWMFVAGLVLMIAVVVVIGAVAKRALTRMGESSKRKAQSEEQEP